MHEATPGDNARGSSRRQNGAPTTLSPQSHVKSYPQSDEDGREALFQLVDQISQNNTQATKVLSKELLQNLKDHSQKTLHDRHTV